jgi:hypothetical protein
MLKFYLLIVLKFLIWIIFDEELTIEAQELSNWSPKFIDNQPLLN